MGTGLFEGEYVVASKSVGRNLRLTTGLGWGRLGSYKPIAQMGTRKNRYYGKGGIPSFGKWFRGDVAPFAGVEWSPNEKLTLKAEYSSDAYAREVRVGSFQHKTPLNFGLDYRLGKSINLGVYALHGSEIGFSLTFLNNLKKSTIPGGLETAPTPVRRRTPAERRDLGWIKADASTAEIRADLKAALERDGLGYEGIDLHPQSATLRLRNTRYGNEAEALGRAARSMTRILPGSIETFNIVPVVNGLPTSTVTFNRSDLENLENAPAEQLFARTMVSDAFGRSPLAEAGIYPKFNWSLSPYAGLSLFDPASPVRLDVGLRVKMNYKLASNIEIASSISKKLVGNIGSATREDYTSLYPVRTDAAKYAREGDPSIDYLTLSIFQRLGKDLYGRATVGYLEKMYAGLSTEVLWKPVDSRLALGIELNAVKQREFDQLFGFKDYSTVTGHVSAYYDLGKGYHGQLDVGRYLAGDYGATISLDREFGNGWRIGAYATFKNVSAEDFGEGSFDKGIRMTIPLQAILGQPTRKETSLDLRSLTRDGGARLEIRDRLYRRVRNYHRPELGKKWGRVWR